MLISKLRQFQREESGGVLIYAAAGIVAFVGLTAVSVDVGFWYATKRTMQAAADAAAIAAVLEVSQGATESEAQTIAENSTADNGHDVADGVTVVVNTPPDNGAYVGDARAAEVIVSRAAPLYFSSVLQDSPVTITTRAVAKAINKPACIQSLNPSISDAINVAGTADLTANCGIQINSNDSQALTVDGGACLNVTGIGVVGGHTGSCMNPPPSAANVADDPYAYLEPPTLGACDHAALVDVTTAGTILDPGYYCGGLRITADTTLNPGTYSMGGIGFWIEGNGHVQGDGVTIYLKENIDGVKPSGPPSTPRIAVYIAGTSSATLSAPTGDGDPYKGILFYMDRVQTYTFINRIEGGSDTELTGVLYFPTVSLRYAGNNATGAPWTYIIADTVQITGTSYFGSGNPEDVDLPAALTGAALVE